MLRLKPAAKPLLFVLMLLPFAQLLYGAFANTLGANPAEALIRGTGDWVLRFLCLTLAVTPLRQWTGWHALARLRRMLGLYAFFYGVLHFLCYAWLDMGLDLAAIWHDIPKRPFILVGTLGRDPESKPFANGQSLCTFSIATSDQWTDKQTGERKENTQWHNIVIKNENLITIAERYLKKGSKVYIEGRLESRKYTDKDGAEKYTTEVVLPPFRGELTMLDSAGGRGEDRKSVV